MGDMEHEFMSRGYLLPPGCKDLIDVLNLKAQPAHSAHWADFSLKSTPQQHSSHVLKMLKKLKALGLKMESNQMFPKLPAALPLPVSQMVIPAETTVAQLAALLGQKPFQIIADVMELGLFVFPEDPLSFEIISSVARKHGFQVIRAGA